MVMWNTDRTHGDVFSKAPKLGPGTLSSSITPSEQSHGPPLIFDATEDSNINSKYVLSGGERKYAKTGHSAESSRQNDAILKKRDLLAERVQHIIDDVSILYDSQYLSQEHWEDGLVDRQDTRSKYTELHRRLRGSDKNVSEIVSNLDDVDTDHYETPYTSPADLWQDLINVSERSQQVRDDVFFHGDSVVSKETQFGFEIGSILKMLRPNHDDEVEALDLIWGFLLAFIGNPHDNVDDEQDKLNKLISEIEKYHHARRQEVEVYPEPDEIANLTPEFHEETVTAIEEKGFLVNPVLVREIFYHQPPIVESKEVHKKSVKSVLEELSDAVPLQEVDSLAHAVSDDISTLHNKNPGGVESVRSLLLSVWDLLDESSGKEAVSNEASARSANTDDVDGQQKSVYKRQPISNIVDYGEWDQSSVTRVFNRISEPDHDRRWTTAPILDKIEGEGNQVSWRFTPYGGLLTHILNSKDGGIDSLYWYAIGPEELSLFERKLILDSFDYLDLVDAGPTYRAP